jgi:hypothetical protein
VIDNWLLVTVININCSKDQTNPEHR